MYQKNDELELKVVSLGELGQGIARFDGFVFFVQGGVVGDVIIAKILKMKKSYGYAKILEILVPSPQRVTPVCSFFPMCGGCQIQNMSYDAQLDFKTEKVKGCIDKIAGLDPYICSKTIGMEKPYRYRNKGQFPVRFIEGKREVGLYGVRSHRLIPLKNCMLQPIETEGILKIVINFLNANEISLYDEEQGKGLVRNILVRRSYLTGEIMLCLVINGKSLPSYEKLISALNGKYQVGTVVINTNLFKTNVIMGDENKILFGNGYITDAVGDIRYQISAPSFFQVNPVQTKVLYDKVIEFANFTKTDIVLDAYCGVGTIALYVARLVKNVVGFEIVPQAISDANANAKLNGITNTTFIVGKAEDLIKTIFTETKFDVLIVDPPRKGCDESFISSVIEIAPKKIIYVSCDCATLARDLKKFCENLYTCKKISPIDCFPQTSHVETIVLLERQTINY